MAKNIFKYIDKHLRAFTLYYSQDADILKIEFKFGSDWHTFQNVYQYFSIRPSSLQRLICQPTMILNCLDCLLERPFHNFLKDFKTQKHLKLLKQS